MKIATVLSVSAFLAMFSVVACSSPTTPAGGDDSSDSAATKKADKDSDDDDKDSKTSTTSNTNTNTNTNTTPATGDDDDDDAFAACDTCMANKEPKYKQALDCAEKASSEDAADQCFVSAGCDGSANDICEKAHDACQAECKAADDQMEAEDQAWDACVSKNAQAKAINDCEIAAKSEADFDKCDAMQCDQNCENTFETCDSQAGGGDE
jgi:hypothetical protein